MVVVYCSSSKDNTLILRLISHTTASVTTIQMMDGIFRLTLSVLLQENLTSILMQMILIVQLMYLVQILFTEEKEIIKRKEIINLMLVVQKMVLRKDIQKENQKEKMVKTILLHQTMILLEGLSKLFSKEGKKKRVMKIIGIIKIILYHQLTKEVKHIKMAQISIPIEKLKQKNLCKKNMGITGKVKLILRLVFKK